MDPFCFSQIRLRSFPCAVALLLGRNQPEASLLTPVSPLVLRRNRVRHLASQQVVRSEPSPRFSQTLPALASINFLLFLFLFSHEKNPTIFH